MLRARILFSPGNAIADARWLSKFHRALRRNSEVLLLATQSSELTLGAIPGSHTLLVPRFPVLAEAALQAADAVITGSVEIAEKAERRQVATWRLCADDSKRDPNVMAREIVSQLTRRIDAPPATPNRETELELCAVADHRYLPSLIGLLANLDRLGFPHEHFHLLALDDKMRSAVAQRYPRLRLLAPSDLWQETEWQRVAQHGAGAKAFASKPRLLQRVQQDTARPVLYTDLDIFYFESPEPLAQAIGEAPVLLFPQWNDQLWHSKFYGVFNAGMVLVQSGADSFLHWWSDHCLHDYNGNFLQGYYADQGFLDLAPVYFPQTAVYREGDHNLAYWNTDTLVESFRPVVDELPQLRSGRSLKSFHAAVPDRLGMYEWKFGWDQITSFFAEVPAESRELLEEAAVLQQSEHWLAVSRLRKLEQVFGRKLHLWHPKVAQFFLYSPFRHLLHVAARTHYHLNRLRRRQRDDASTNQSHLALSRQSDDPAVL